MRGVGIFQAEGQLCMQILSPEFSAAASPRSSGPSEEGLEEIREFAAFFKFAAIETTASRTAKTFPETSCAAGAPSSCAGALLSSSSATGALGFFECFGMLPVFAVLIVLLPFVRVAQYFVGFVDLLKFLIGFFIGGVQVGMKFPGQLTVCIFNLLRLGVLIHSQYLIIIDEVHVLPFLQISVI